MKKIVALALFIFSISFLMIRNKPIEETQGLAPYKKVFLIDF
jgi:hypothetical protein